MNTTPHYEIRHEQTGELTGYFTTRRLAEQEAERLCSANQRKVRFTVVKMTDVYETEGD
jgi:hypothetical protein